MVGPKQLLVLLGSPINHSWLCSDPHQYLETNYPRPPQRQLFAPLPFKLSRQMLAPRCETQHWIVPKSTNVIFNGCRPPRCVQHRGPVGQDALCGKTPVFQGNHPEGFDPRAPCRGSCGLWIICSQPPRSIIPPSRSSF